MEGRQGLVRSLSHVVETHQEHDLIIVFRNMILARPSVHCSTLRWPRTTFSSLPIGDKRIFVKRLYCYLRSSDKDKKGRRTQSEKR